VKANQVENFCENSSRKERQGAKKNLANFASFGLTQDKLGASSEQSRRRKTWRTLRLCVRLCNREGSGMLVETQESSLLPRRRAAEKSKNGASIAPAGSSAPAASSAPMASAPFRYRVDGEVDWGNMWDTFCDLALDGGPPHRGTLLEAPVHVDPASEGYCRAVIEITRGISEVSGLTAEAAEPGWLRIACQSPAQARWLAEAILSENVAARHQASYLFVPAGDQFTVKGEIKNVITAVAKTTHYWNEHLALEVKQTLAAQEALAHLTSGLVSRLKRFLGYRRPQ
jgi:sirohydrochlorin cobaltochelatase